MKLDDTISCGGRFASLCVDIGYSNSIKGLGFDVEERIALGGDI